MDIRSISVNINKPTEIYSGKSNKNIDSISDNNTKTSPSKQPQSNPGSDKNKPKDFSESEKRLIDNLKFIDIAVKSHEMAHIAAGGSYITSGAQYQYQMGPDGNNYAIGGEVGIDSSPIPDDPQATMEKMQVVRGAALAPADPSAQDVSVASKASQISVKASMELIKLYAKKSLIKGYSTFQSFNQNSNDINAGSIIDIAV